MEKTKKIKISLALIYGFIISLIFWAFFSKFSLNDLTSYEFIKNNKDYLIVIKESNYLLVLVLFFGQEEAKKEIRKSWPKICSNC